MTYPLRRAPEQVEVVWDRFNRYIFSVRSVVYAYEQTLNHLFSRYGSAQSFTWTNPGRPPLPEILPVGLEGLRAPELDVPAASLGCLAAAPLLAFALWRCGVKRSWRLTLAMALFAGAIALWPVAHVSMADPFYQPRLEADAVGSIFSRLHQNVYRAFDYHDESDIYDALARSVDGPLLEQLYLQIHQGLAMQEQGGAISRIGQVHIVAGQPEIPQDFEPAQGFRYRCQWTVEGTVEHWGHIHARTNQYEAVFQVAERGDAWKITSAELLNEERLQFETRLRGMN
jgi:hypothetical protein